MDISTSSANCVDDKISHLTYETFVEAGRQGDISELKRHFDCNKFDINSSTWDSSESSDTVLMAIMRYRNPNLTLEIATTIVKLFINGGADIGFASGCLTLYLRASSSVLSLDDPYSHHFTVAIIKACDAPLLRITKQFVKSSDSPLHLLCVMGMSAIVATLLSDHSASVDTRSYNGYTPLHCACLESRVDVVETLIAAGASVNLVNDKCESALHLIHNNETSVDLASLLIKAGADINAVDKHGNTPLFSACIHNDFKVATLLIDAKADSSLLNNEGDAILHHACVCGYTPVIAALLAARADVNILTSEGVTAVHFAAKYGNVSLAKTLLAMQETNVNVSDSQGNTPLHHACFDGNVEMTRLLINAGADVDVANEDGYMPLHCACYRHQVKVAELLVKAGADINAVDLDEKTTLHIAAESGYCDFVKLMIRELANNALDGENK